MPISFPFFLLSRPSTTYRGCSGPKIGPTPGDICNGSKIQKSWVRIKGISFPILDPNLQYARKIRNVLKSHQKSNHTSDLCQVFAVDDIFTFWMDISGTIRVKNSSIQAAFFQLSIQIIDPFHRLYIADFTQISFYGRQIRMA